MSTMCLIVRPICHLPDVLWRASVVACVWQRMRVYPSYAEGQDISLSALCFFAVRLHSAKSPSGYLWG